MDSRAAREESMISTEEEKAAQKLFANGNNTPSTLSAIGVGLLALVMVLGVRIRRGLQPATVLASSGADMSINMAPGLGDNIMEMKSQGLDSAPTVGWGSLPSQSSRPLTPCNVLESPVEIQTDESPMGMYTYGAAQVHGAEG